MWNKFFIFLLVLWVIKSFYSEYSLMEEIRSLSYPQQQEMKIIKDSSTWYLIYPENPPAGGKMEELKYER